MNKYPLTIRIIHWAMAIIIIGLVISGFTHDDWPKEFQKSFYYWHKSFGMLALILVALRFTLKLSLKSKFPPLPDSIPAKDKKFATAGHHSLYLLMILVPLSGYFMSMAGGYGISMFGIKIPNILSEKNESLGDVASIAHEITGIAIAIIVTIHIVAVIKHKIKENENLLNRMV